MKCVRSNKTAGGPDIVRRLPNDAAARLIAGGAWHHTTKGAWKAAGRPRPVKRTRRIVVESGGSKK